MARRVEKLLITAAGRDHGKVFILTEMSAMQAERWATRAMLALVRNGGATIPEDAANAGIAGLASMGIAALGGVHAEELEPLLDDMLRCVSVETVGMPRTLHGDDDIEEVTTLLLIRERLLDLHLGGSVRGFFSRLTTKTPARTPTSAATRDIAA